MINPRPKLKTTRLKGKEYKEFRELVYREYGGICDNCGMPAPLYDADGQFDTFTCGHVAHVKSHGAGGSDIITNVRWRCYDCHIGKEHGPQWGKNDDKN